jgi:hypothetical protein
MPERSTRLLACLLALAVTLTGCEAMRFLAYLFEPAVNKKKIPPEYDGLAGHSMAVVVFASPRIQHEHPRIQLDVSLMVGARVEENVSDVTVVPGQKVVKYQHEHIDWEEYERARVGRDLGADFVLYIALEKFATLEPGSLQLYRGRVTAHAAVYQSTASGRQAKVWGPQDFNVIYPEQEHPVGSAGQSDRKIRFETVKILAEMLAKKFYEHEVVPE